MFSAEVIRLLHTAPLPPPEGLEARFQGMTTVDRPSPRRRTDITPSLSALQAAGGAVSSGARVAVAPRAGGKKRKGAHATAEASAVDGTPAAAAAAAAVTTAALAGGGGEGSVAGAGAPAAAVVDYCGSGIDDRPAGEEPSPLSAMHPPLRTLLADSACCWRDTHCASNRAVGSPRMSLTFELQCCCPFMAYVPSSDCMPATPSSYIACSYVLLPYP